MGICTPMLPPNVRPFQASTLAVSERRSSMTKPLSFIHGAQSTLCFPYRPNTAFCTMQSSLDLELAEARLCELILFIGYRKGPPVFPPGVHCLIARSGEGTRPDRPQVSASGGLLTCERGSTACAEANCPVKIPQSIAPQRFQGFMLFSNNLAK